MMKKKINARAKGAQFERTVCKLLQKWWGRGEFTRTKNLQILSKDRTRIAYGDVACLLKTSLPELDPLFPFSVECKKNEAWDFADLLKGNIVQTIESWWGQCTRDAARWNKIPLLIFSRNNYGVYVASTDLHLLNYPILANQEESSPRFMVSLRVSHFHVVAWEQFTKAFMVDWNLPAEAGSKK